MRPQSLTVYYDDHCPFCVWCRDWLARSLQAVPLRLVSCHSQEAYERVPPNEIGGELLILAEDGRMWQGPAAFLVCLWSLDAWRPFARLLSTAALRPFADLFFTLVSSHRAGLGRVLGLPSCETGHCEAPRGRVGVYR